MQAMNIELNPGKEPVSYRKADRREAQHKPEQSFRDAIRKAAEGARSSEPVREPDKMMTDKGEKAQNPDSNTAAATTPVTASQDDISGELAAAQASAMISLMTAQDVIAVVPLEGQSEEPVQQTVPLIHADQAGQIIANGMPQQPQQGLKGNAAQPQPVSQQANAGNGQTKPDLAEAAKAEQPQQAINKQAAEVPKPVEPEGQQKQTAGIEIKSSSETKEMKQDTPSFAKPEMALNTDKVYVKVGDGGTVNTRQFSADISEKLMQRMADGRQQFEIELMPQELGKIAIKLVIEGGKAIFTMQCMNPKTQQLMMMNAESIRNIIQEGTNMQTTVNVKENADGDLNYGDLDDRNEKNQQEENANEKKEWTEAEATTFMQQLRLGLVGET